VQRALTSRVACGDTRIGALARQLALSGRTLQRRLTPKASPIRNCSTRRARKRRGRHLSESALAIREVAYLVGYSEPAPFYRAFKRWYGTTPEVFRQKRRGNQEVV
jgi:AraC-like DNA-binding protein